jgi:AcrR family transcriptional regulator
MSPRSTFAEYRLPPGRHGIPPEEVAANQRWRLLGAATEELAENGRLATTSTSVARRASVSPATFYKHYENISACLLAAYEMSAECLMQAVTAACREPSLEWTRRLREALDSALRFLADEPAIAATLGAAAPVDEPEIAAARERLLGRLAELLTEGRGLRPADAPELPAGREHTLAAAALTLVTERARDGRCGTLPGLAPELAILLDTSGAGPHHFSGSSIARS